MGIDCFPHQIIRMNMFIGHADLSYSAVARVIKLLKEWKNNSMGFFGGGVMELEMLKRGYIKATSYYFEVDLPFYNEHLKDFLPDQIIDIHSHVATPEMLKPDAKPPTFWAERVCPNGMSVESLIESYELMFPGKKVTPVIFGLPSDRFILEKENEYVSKCVEKFGLNALILTRPSWSSEELERHIKEGGFIGLKPYPSMAKGKKPDEIEIFDYLPKHHLELANEKRWLIILHIPRSGRLDDETNIKQLLEIDEKYPHAKVVVAHVGRSYCPKQGEKGLDRLKDSQNLFFDISANTNEAIFERLIEIIGTKRILFGSDMPISGMHAKRICKDSNYINVILGADWVDEHTRPASPEDRVTFFLYEEIYAFRKAAEKMGLGRKDIEDVFLLNARRILE